MKAEDDTRTHILIVDDHARIREGIRELVQQHQDLHVVGEAGDGVTAVELARRLRPHIVLMDFVMPVMDGAWEANYPGLASDQDYRVLVNLRSRELMLASGAFIFFEKSNITDELPKALRRAVEMLSRRRQLRISVAGSGTGRSCLAGAMPPPASAWRGINRLCPFAGWSHQAPAWRPRSAGGEADLGGMKLSPTLNSRVVHWSAFSRSSSRRLRRGSANLMQHASTRRFTHT